MSVEERKAIVRWALQVLWNAGTLEVLDEVVAEDVVVHERAATLRGAAAVKDAVSAIRAAHPGLELQVEQQAGDGDLVATRWTATADGVAASGIELARFADGKVVELWESWQAS